MRSITLSTLVFVLILVLTSQVSITNKLRKANSESNATTKCTENDKYCESSLSCCSGYCATVGKSCKSYFWLLLK
jgi:hypothetical protein